MHLCRRFFQSSIYFWNALFGIENSACFDTYFISWFIRHSHIRGVIKKYLFINNYLVPFNVTSLTYNTLMTAFFPILETLLKRTFWNRQQRLSLLWFLFHLLNRSKTLYFHRCLQLWEEEKVSGGQVQHIWWLRRDYDFVCFDQKLTHNHRSVSSCIIMGQNPWLVFPYLYVFLKNCFAQSAHNFKVVFFIDRTTFLQEFMMHWAIAIEGKRKQNLHNWPNLAYFFRFWIFWTLSLGWLMIISFNILAIRLD